MPSGAAALRISERTLLLTTFFFIFTVVSFERYATEQLLPLLLFPLSLGIFLSVPVAPLLKRLSLALPFVLLIALGNPFFDRAPLPFLEWKIARGWFSFVSIQLRFLLTVSSTLVLVCAIGVAGVTRALAELKIPPAFIWQLTLLNRYVALLAAESASVRRAHALRGRRITLGNFPQLAAQLLARCYQRSERIGWAMLCREYSPRLNVQVCAPARPLRLPDILFLAGWGAFFLSTRCFNLPLHLGACFLRALS